MSIRKACKLLGYDKSTFFQVQNNRRRIEQEEELIIAFVLRKVKAIRKDMPKAGGKKMFHSIIQDPDYAKYKFGRDKFFDILRMNNLLVKRRKKPVYTTDSSKWRKQYPNLLVGLTPTRPEQVFVADITYFRTENGFIYGHLVTDAYSKKIMGYMIADDMKASSTLEAMKMAVENRIYDEPLIHHSDRGFQYLSKLYTDLLKEHKIAISVTQDGSPYDNAIAERINGILKSEFFVNSNPILGKISNTLNRNNSISLKCIGLNEDQIKITWTSEKGDSSVVYKHGKITKKIGHESGRNYFIIQTDNNSAISYIHFKTHDWYSHHYDIELKKYDQKYIVHFDVQGPESISMLDSFDLQGNLLVDW